MFCQWWDPSFVCLSLRAARSSFSQVWVICRWTPCWAEPEDGSFLAGAARGPCVALSCSLSSSSRSHVHPLPFCSPLPLCLGAFLPASCWLSCLESGLHRELPREPPPTTHCSSPSWQHFKPCWLHLCGLALHSVPHVESLLLGPGAPGSPSPQAL